MMKQYFVADSEQDVQFTFEAGNDEAAAIIAKAYSQAYPELNLVLDYVES